MSLLEIMSADYLFNAGLAAAGWSGAALGGGGAPSTARGNRFAMFLPSGSIYKSYTAPIAPVGSTVTIGVALAGTSWGGGGSDLITILNAATQDVLRLRTISGALTLINSAGAALATGPTFVGGNVNGPWYYLELQFTIANSSTFNVEVRVNGTTVIANASYAFGGQNSSAATQIRFWNQGSGSIYAQDFYILDSQGSVNTTFLGDCRVENLLPTAVGAHDAWTLGAGASKTAAVTAVGDGDTSYIKTLNSGDRQTYTLADLGSTAGVVKGVAIAVAARGENNGSQKVSATVRTGGVSFDGTDYGLAPNVGYGRVGSIRQINPNTGAAWTAAEINALEAGPLVLA